MGAVSLNSLQRIGKAYDFACGVTSYMTVNTREATTKSPPPMIVTIGLSQINRKGKVSGNAPIPIELLFP